MRVVTRLVIPGHIAAADLADIHGWSVGTVHKRASRGGWRRVKVGTEVYYLLADVDDTPKRA